MDKQLERFFVHLRNNFRLKVDVDFAYTQKYGELHILCHAAFEDNIKEEAEKFGVIITKFHTYGNDVRTVSDPYIRNYP